MLGEIGDQMSIMTKREQETNKHIEIQRKTGQHTHVMLCPSCTFLFIWSRMSKYKITFSQLTSLYCAPYKCIHKIIVLWVKIDSQRKFFFLHFYHSHCRVFFLFMLVSSVSLSMFICLSLSFRALVNYLVVKFYIHTCICVACVCLCFCFAKSSHNIYTVRKYFAHYSISINLHTWIM